MEIDFEPKTNSQKENNEHYYQYMSTISEHLRLVEEVLN